MSGDIRSAERHALPGRVLVTWPDGQGNFKFAAAKCLDVSRSGVRLQLPEPLGVRTYVTIRCDELELGCSASVRYCKQCGLRFAVGLEFSHPLEADHPAVRASQRNAQKRPD